MKMGRNMKRGEVSNIFSRKVNLETRLNFSQHKKLVIPLLPIFSEKRNENRRKENIDTNTDWNNRY